MSTRIEPCFEMNHMGNAVLAVAFLGCLLLAASPANSEVVFCRKGKNVRVREDVCRGKETLMQVLPATPDPSPTTLTGTWGGRLPNPNEISTPSYLLTVTLPTPALVALANADVNFAADADLVTSDDDSACIGSVDAPTAPPGKVCLYVDRHDVQDLSGFSLSISEEGIDMDRFGFLVRVIGDPEGNEMLTAVGTWAYTPPSASSERCVRRDRSEGPSPCGSRRTVRDGSVSQRH